MKPAIILAACAASLVFAETDPVSVISPDGQIQLRLFIVTPKDRVIVRLAYAVTFHGKVLMDTSMLGLAIYDQEPLLGENVGLSTVKRESVDETHYNSVVAQYLQNGSLGRRVVIEARAYNDGVAFRYYIPLSSPVANLQIEEELTDFRFAQDGESYSRTSSENAYQRNKLGSLPRDSRIGLPFLVEQAGVGWVAITEAELDNYPGMALFHPEQNTMRTTLSPRLDNAAVAMSGVSPAESPWRVLMIASEPRKLLESNIVKNLNAPSAIADTSWIRPAKEYVPIDGGGEMDAQMERVTAGGVKIDLKHRADQQAIEIYRRAAKAAAAHHLMIEFENGPAADGIERTWPNVVPRDDASFKRLIERF